MLQTEKLNKSLAVLFTLCLIFLPLVSTKAAALIDIGLGGSSSYNVKTLMDSEVEVDADVNAGVNVNTNSATTSAGSSAGAGGEASVSETSVRATIIDAGSNIRVLRSDIKKDKPAAGASLSASTAADGNADAVMLASDLEDFAQGTVASDENVEEIYFTQDSTLMSYKQQGKLLGIFPVTFIATVTVGVDGSVDVKYPWYAFVVSKDEEQLEAELEAAIAEVRSESRADAEAQVFSASEQAKIIARMHAVLKAHLETEESEEEKTIKE